MKKKALLCALTLLLLSCSKEGGQKDTSANVTFNFTHHWDNSAVSSSDFNSIRYTNANGEQLSIEKLRYLISGIKFQRSDGEIISVKGHNLVDVGNGTNLSYAIKEGIPAGNYSHVSFIFGFDNENNVNGAYPDLNSVLWNVPEMLGGGYHYMQLEGKFIDHTTTEIGYQYHAIRAVDTSGPEMKFEDTFFKVDLGPIEIQDDIALEIRMNIAEWFKNPNQWNLNTLHSMMMPNFDAQLLISENGKSAFSLGEIVE